METRLATQSIQKFERQLDKSWASISMSDRECVFQVEYNKCIVLAGLSFFKHLAKLKDRPLKTIPPPPSQPLPELKPEPGQPVTLGERVFHAFAQQNMPVHKPLSLPVTQMSLACPGMSSCFYFLLRCFDPRLAASQKCSSNFWKGE